MLPAAYSPESIASGLRDGFERPLSIFQRRRSIRRFIRRKPRYNLLMSFALLAMHILDTMFFVGLVGSSIVVLISFVEDGKELFGEDEPVQPKS
jgi:hypothetical protein